MDNNGKKEWIIKAAFRIVSKENYENMKTASVAREAGISEGTIYRYFNSKRELFIEVLRFVNKRLAELLLEGVDRNKNLRENLIVVAGNFFQRSGESDELYKIFYKAFSEVDDSEIKEVLGEIFDQSIEAVKEILKLISRETKRDITDNRLEIAAMLLWGFGDIAWKRDTVAGKKEIPAEEMENVIDMILGLIG